ncbi:MAG: LapA family protein [Gammaproteobacteria bacterium]|uniref:LapA family protein n=1 Tax=Rhodoferax sp. TaxID=50421 RepID=UPI0017B84C37|nr:LapA family protein [Rhodoferax sp.]MBU3898081.1 LapA family protein [Gammaproteobacteria bacterium]MBA3056396.1 LapA family protein [Rhodoferax sp.]MBU3999162.1 LapA family protein [Gammaproteobacteria bacterium]MBU4081725.1 LapA family protein [Gammaproteobacteria bacterium]MBU4114619.1 LapA family protein [Gammaproteobacteria bacterium]
MKIRTLLLLLVLSLIIAFTALNWSTFLAPTTLYLGLAEVQAPLGLVMLGLLVFVTGLFLVFVLYLQTTVLFDARQHAKELQSNRKLADQAEASRFTELRSFLDAELKKQIDQDGHSRAVVLTRIDQMEGTLRAVVEQSGNSLAASLGELEDRLDRGNKDVTHNLLA